MDYHSLLLHLNFDMSEIVTDWINKWSDYSPIKTAVKDISTNESLTYRQLNQSANSIAAYLETRYNINKGDRVAVLSEFNLAYVALFSAAQKLGFILVPLNYRLTQRELSYMLNNCTAKLLIQQDIYAKEFDSKLMPLSNQINIEELDELIQNERNLGSPKIRQKVTLNDPLFIIYTSGTTGFPKGAIYTHKMAFWNSINSQLRLDIRSSDHTITCMPPFHTGGWNVLLTPFLHHGASVSLINKFEPDRILNLLQEEESNLFMGVPTMLKMMSEVPEFDKVNLDSVRYFIVGGEAMPVDLINTWQQKGIPIRQGYGLTEVGPNITSLHHDDAIRKIGSIGKPNFYVNYRLVKPDGNDAGFNEKGELWLSGPMTTPGYWENEKETLKSLIDGWFKTGDILTKDEEGYLYVVDRIKNMFISGGENVYPAEIEKFLQQHKGIDEVAVISVPDKKWGEVGKALIVNHDQTLTTQHIYNYCSGKLAKYKIPKHIEFVHSLPKTDTGKIDRKNLNSTYT